MSNLSRRRFIATAGAAVGFGAIASACGGGDVTAASCEGYDALTPGDLQARQALGYVDVTPDPAQRCDNCRLYNAPVGGSACGGCQLFQGPVAPAGYCTAWAPTA